jgi:hypothetical protein
LVNIFKLIDKNTEVVNIDLINKIVALSGKIYLILELLLQTSGVNNYLDTLQVSNLAIQTYSIASKDNNIKQKDLKQLKSLSNDLQIKSSELVEKMALNSNETYTVVGNIYLSSQIIKANNSTMDEWLSDSLTNGLSIVNVSQCITKIKSYYNISNNDNLTVIKTDTDASLGVENDDDTPAGSKEVQINIYYDNKKLNISVCDQSDINIKIPIDNSTMFNITKYNLFKEQGIDIFDPNDPYFTSRCNSYSSDGYDTTVNMRLKNLYTNISISCSDGCRYDGIDEYNYVKCDCAMVVQNYKFRSKWKKFVLKQLISLNFDIIKCPNRVFNVYTSYNF